MSVLEFSLAALLVVIGFGFLTFSGRVADRVAGFVIICAVMASSGEPLVEILKGIGLFTAVVGLFILLAMTGSILLAKGVLLFLPL